MTDIDLERRDSLDKEIIELAFNTVRKKGARKEKKGDSRSRWQKSEPPTGDNTIYNSENIT